MMHPVQLLVALAAYSPLASSFAIDARGATATTPDISLTEAATAAKSSCIDDQTIVVTFEKQTILASPANGLGFVDYTGFEVVNKNDPSTVYINPKSGSNMASLSYPLGASMTLDPAYLSVDVSLESFWWACGTELEAEEFQGTPCSIEVLVTDNYYGVTTYGPFTSAGNTAGGLYKEYDWNMTKAVMPSGVQGTEWWFVVTSSGGRDGRVYIDNLVMYGNDPSCASS